MKKTLISVVILIMCILTVFTIVKGIHLGNFTIMGIKEIKEESEKLEKKIAEATKLASTDYPNQLSSINKDIKDMNAEKENYEDMVAVSTDGEISSAIQKQKYTIDKLWTKIGNLATGEGLDAKFTLTNGSLKAADNENFVYCNIEFEVTGSFGGVAEYIRQLEDDSELGFRIEDLNMLPKEDEDDEDNDGKRVIATFKTKDIAVEGVVIPEPEEPEEGEEAEETDEDSNPVSDASKKAAAGLVTDGYGLYD